MTDSTQPERQLRIGAVSYLNTKPLIHRFSEFAPNVELILDVPSRLADRLASADLDIALIPSVEAFQDPTYTVVSDACIACRGPVLSVKLLSRVPIAEIRSLALDAGSRTSVALVQILLGERVGVEPELSDLPIGESYEECPCDAVLLIGDRAIHCSSSRFTDRWDLGEQWCDWTGLPFVFAMWTARANIIPQGVESLFQLARDTGMAELETIAALAATDAGLDEPTCLAYLRDNLHFTMGVAEQQGLQLFHQYAAKYGFVPLEHDPNTIGISQS